MWKSKLDQLECNEDHTPNSFTTTTGSLGNQKCLDSADSGFLSGYNSNQCSSECSSKSMISDDTSCTSNNLQQQQQQRGTFSNSSCTKGLQIDSGLDLGLTDSFNHLSLAQLTASDSLDCASNNRQLEPITEVQSGQGTNEDSALRASVDGDSCSALGSVKCQPWQLYFTQNEDGDTLLHTAITHGYDEAALSLICTAPDPSFLDILNDDAQTALHLAVATGQPRIVRRLVLAGADPSARNHRGDTALHAAIVAGDVGCVAALTEPLTVAEKSRCESSTPKIPQDLEQRNYQGLTCLHVAASKGNVELVSRLVELGADLDCRETLGGRTALHLAIEQNCLNVALYLVRECRSDLEATTYSGYTAHQLATFIADVHRPNNNSHSIGSADSIMEQDDFRENLGLGLPRIIA